MFKKELFTERFRRNGDFLSWVKDNINNECDEIALLQHFKTISDPLTYTEIHYLLQEDIYIKHKELVKNIFEVHELTSDVFRISDQILKDIDWSENTEYIMFLGNIKDRVIQNNKQLIERYPFLEVRNVCTGERYPEDERFLDTWLDWMPCGWRKGFALSLCENIRRILIKGNYLYDYRVIQIKEKYGSLRWYDSGAPDSIYDELSDCIMSYESMSTNICIHCGKPAKNVMCGWITFLCDDCVPKNRHYMKMGDSVINNEDTYYRHPNTDIETKIN